MKSQVRYRTALAIALTAIAGLLAVGCAAEDEIQREANKEEASLLQPELDALVDAGVPGAVLVVDDPEADPIELTSGVSDIDSGRKVESGDRFRIGSLAKSYVATVVMQLAEEGKLSLDDAVADILPGLVPNGDEITVRDLLGHRSGLYEYEEDPRVLKPYLAGDYGYTWKPRQLIEIANSHAPTADPGTRVVYSNTNYTVLGLVVEEATGRGLGTELEDRVFDPLDLQRTEFVESAKIEKPYSRGYLAGRGEPLDVTEISPSHYWAAGNIVSTGGEVGRFYEALFAGELVSDQSLEEMETVVEERPGLERGLGIVREPVDCGSSYGHDGSVPGYDAVARHLDSGRQVVVLANTITIGDAIGSPAAQQALADLVDSASCR